MKALVLSHLLVLFLIPTTFISADESVTTLFPASPKIGDVVTIMYNAEAQSAVLKSSKAIMANVLLVRGQDLPMLIEVPLNKQDKMWRGMFTLSDPKACFLLYQFVDKEKTDNNNDNVWRALISDSSGNPVRNSYFYSGIVMNSPNYFNFKNQKSPIAAKEEIKRELHLYPDNWDAQTFEWDIDFRNSPNEETKTRVLQELNALVSRYTNNDTVLASLLRWFDRVSEKAKGDSIKQKFINEHPKGKIAENDALSKVYREQDQVKRIEGLEKFLMEFTPDANTKKNLESNLIYFYTQAKQYDKAIQLLESSKNPDLGIYNNIAWAFIEKGENVKKGIELAQKGIAVLRNNNIEGKPSYLSTTEWKRNNTQLLAMTLDTYGFGCMHSKKTKDAEAAYLEAYQLSKGENPYINNHIVEAYNANGNYKQAVKLAEESIGNGISNDLLLASYKTAYTKLHKSEKGYEKALGKTQAAAQKKLTKNLLKERLNKPAIDFTLKDLEGSSVSLNSLRGKVVVVDFWATWCGPCKSSFPFLQKVYEKYKSNPNVKILAVNTWERQIGAEREALVKKFLEENKYTFPVLYDEGVVEKYGVEGIPTKFIIDKKGIIAFKTIGFGGEGMVSEMTTQLDLLLKE
ncbi:MAG: redoxin domain-containing protein [Bacteroidota bacterium]|nr:redoxin domain-containing protein [Bacteroidota bacterium]